MSKFADSGWFAQFKRWARANADCEHFNSLQAELSSTFDLPT
jgi:hypothetical protein